MDGGGAQLELGRRPVARAVASRSSGRLDTPALGLEAEARSCGNRADDAGAALLRAFQISALASRGPTARHCRNRRKDGMGTTAFPSWCGQRGLIGSSDDDRGDRNSACAPRRCGCALRVGAVVQVRRSGARRARPTIALPRTCERQTHCVAPPRPSVAAATRAVGRRPAAEAETNTERERATTRVGQRRRRLRWQHASGLSGLQFRPALVPAAPVGARSSWSNSTSARPARSIPRQIPSDSKLTTECLHPSWIAGGDTPGPLNRVAGRLGWE